MAELVHVDGQQYKKRGPFAVWGLVFLTLGVYLFVWHYKVNDEARRYLRDESIRPGIALLAILLGWLLIVPPYISIYRTGERIQRMQAMMSETSSIVPLIGLILSFFAALQLPYYQNELNKVWSAAPSGASEPPRPIPPPPSEA